MYCGFEFILNFVCCFKETCVPTMAFKWVVNYVSEILMAYNDKLTDNKTIRKFFIEAFHMIILYRILESDRF